MGQLFHRYVRAAGLGLAALLLAVATASRADDGKHVFWEVAGKHNTVYLLGSVHLLHENDRALPAVTEEAYRDAEVLVEELDIYAMLGEVMSPEALKQQFLPQGQALTEVIGPELDGKLRAAVKPLNLDMNSLSRMQPWYVASMVSSLRLMQAGYNPQDGVDYQIAERAHRDGKPIEGFETAVQQLGFFAAMSMDQQRQFLAATLDETESAAELRQITEAWRRGDLAALESLLKQGMDEAPELFHKIVTDRNRNWLPRIEQMLADPSRDYLVVTGALHMIGSQGLVELLRARGYRITRK
jgi:uncharacterized protein YbaP (TraB family)